MEASSEVEVKSPDEIEEGISSTQTVTWDPFTVFPKEIYVKIFDKLDNPVDKMNFMNAHLKWYELLKTKRTHFLFQHVFKEVVGKKCGENGITRKDSLNYRLVCRDWAKAVEINFQLHDISFRLDSEYGIRTEPGLWVESRCFTWLTGGELENDLRKFSLTHPPSKNPFLSRKIHLYPSLWGSPDREASRRYTTAVESLLEKYGRHIWHCTMTADQTPRTCRLVAKWLGLMPELKTLELCNHNERLNQVGVEEIRDMEFQQPELSKLQVLKFEGLPSDVFNKLFGNLKGLEKIWVSLKEDGQSFLNDFGLRIERDNLKVAYFTFKGIPNFMEYLDRESFPNLKTLAIDEQPGWEPPTMNWQEWGRTFKILEEKLPALEGLFVRLPKAELYEDRAIALYQSLHSTLNLPKLKKLWIALPNLASIDFLSPCKELEELKVILEHGHFNSEARAGLGRREKVKFNKGSNTLWESNVWEEFPKLRVLQVEAFGFGNYKRCYRYEKAGEKRVYKKELVCCSS